MSNSSIQSFVSYWLSQFSVTEMIDEIEPLYPMIGSTSSIPTKELTTSRECFFLLLTLMRLSGNPACALIETYPTLSLDGSGFSNVRDGEAELGLSSNLLVSCTKNEYVLVLKYKTVVKKWV